MWYGCNALRFFGEVSSNGCRPPVTAGVSWWSAMIGGCWAQQTSMERLNRLREANSQWKGIPVGNGPRKEWILKRISTNWQWHKFIWHKCPSSSCPKLSLVWTRAASRTCRLWVFKEFHLRWCLKEFTDDTEICSSDYSNDLWPVEKRTVVECCSDNGSL